MKLLVVFIWVVCGSTQLASGQSPGCTNATLALAGGDGCLSSSNNTFICNGTCRTLFNNILNECSGEVIMYVCMYACMYVYMYVCVRMYRLCRLYIEILHNIYKAYY